MPVGREAVVLSRVGHRDALDDQALVAHNHPLVRVVTQWSSLQKTGRLEAKFHLATWASLYKVIHAFRDFVGRILLRLLEIWQNWQDNWAGDILEQSSQPNLVCDRMVCLCYPLLIPHHNIHPPLCYEYGIPIKALLPFLASHSFPFSALLFSARPSARDYASAKYRRRYLPMPVLLPALRGTGRPPRPKKDRKMVLSSAAVSFLRHAVISLLLLPCPIPKEKREAEIMGFCIPECKYEERTAH